jgi:hypothetical protein
LDGLHGKFSPHVGMRAWVERNEMEEIRRQVTSESFSLDLILVVRVDCMEMLQQDGEFAIPFSDSHSSSATWQLDAAKLRPSKIYPPKSRFGADRTEISIYKQRN